MSKRDELIQKYHRTLHAMQTGVRVYTEQSIPNETPELQRLVKHLRVGVNSAQCDVGAFMALLQEKGVLDDSDLDRYYEILIGLMQQDVDGYEKQLKEDFGLDIKLG